MLVLQLRDKRAGLVAKGRAILDAAQKESRALTGEDTTQYEAIMADVDGLKRQIDLLERQAVAEASIAAGIDATTRAGGLPADGSVLTRGVDQRTLELRKFLRGELSPNGTFEMRALQADSGTAGGYLVQAEAFVAQLIKFVDDEVHIRREATKHQVANADSLGIAKLTADPADADWTSELATGSADSTMAFGKRTLKPHPLAKRIKVSNKLMRLAMMSPEAMVAQRLAYKFAITEEKAFLTGSGAGRPLGLFVATADGISTGRDVTAASATVFTADEVINTLYSCKAQYMAKGKWLMHRDTLLRVRKLKDGNGQYLWQPGLAGGQPDALLNRPIMMSEYAPNTYTTGLYVLAFGDFAFYHIADSLSMQLQRLNELYAETDETGFIARMELDGQPVLEEAFARLKLA